MSTVLPTPAPPNRPILPPLAYGASRSMTLMPVSRISVVGFCWANTGGARWIDHFSCASTVPFSSMGCPSTLNIRPSVASPTGASMVRPVDSTSSPRPIPSLGESIMQRTVSPPICCATSIMRTCPSGATDRASLISGRPPPSKATSTTGPVTCTTVPLRFIVFFLTFYARLPSARKRTVRVGIERRGCALPCVPPTISVISCVMADCRARL